LGNAKEMRTLKTRKWREKPNSFNCTFAVRWLLGSGLVLAGLSDEKKN
jgi:hypothetical protein